MHDIGRVVLYILVQEWFVTRSITCWLITAVYHRISRRLRHNTWANLHRYTSYCLCIFESLRRCVYFLNKNIDNLLHWNEKNRMPWLDFYQRQTIISNSWACVCLFSLSAYFNVGLMCSRRGTQNEKAHVVSKSDY